jgi:hypothetical protein
MVPYELSVGLDQLHHLAVKFAGYVRLVVFGNFGELFGDVYLVHNDHPERKCNSANDVL